MSMMACACTSLRPKRSMRAALAMSGVWEPRMMEMISSMWSRAMSSPRRIWARFSAGRGRSACGAPHVVPVVHEMADEILQVQQDGPAVHQRDVVYRETGLQLRVFVEGVEYHARHGVALEDDDDARTAAVAFVVDVRDAVDFLLVNHVGNLTYHLGLVHLIGNLRHDDALPAAVSVLYFCSGPHDDASASRFERLTHPS